MTGTAAEKIISEFKRLSAEEQEEVLKQLEGELNWHGTSGSNNPDVKTSLLYSEPKEHAPGLIDQPRLVGTYTPKNRSHEYEWLRRHRDEYGDQWVALDGDRLLSHGLDLKEVIRTAKQIEGADPIFIRVEPSDALPFAGF